MSTSNIKSPPRGAVLEANGHGFGAELVDGLRSRPQDRPGRPRTPERYSACSAGASE